MADTCTCINSDLGGNDFDLINLYLCDDLNISFNFDLCCRSELSALLTPSMTSRIHPFELLNIVVI